MPKTPPPEVEVAATQLTAALGLPVDTAPLFGSFGFRCEGAMIAGMIPSNGMYSEKSVKLRIDKDSKAMFEEAGGEPFEYERNGKIITMPYRSLPSEIMQDPDLLRPYAEHALRAAKAAQKKKKK